MPAPLSTRSQMVVIAFTYAAAACAAAMAAPELRMWLLTTLRRETGRGADAVG
jgi:hypothetical protein